MTGIKNLVVVGLVLTTVLSFTLAFPQDNFVEEERFPQPGTDLGLDEQEGIMQFEGAELDDDSLQQSEDIKQTQEFDGQEDAEVEGGCASVMYIMAFTSGGGSAGSDDSPYVSVTLVDGREKHVRLYDRPGNDMYPNKGDLWKIPIHSFHFSKRCITKKSIRYVKILNGGNDGWKIESIMTVLRSGNSYDVVTANMGVNRWIDGNGSSYQRQYALRKSY